MISLTQQDRDRFAAYNDLPIEAQRHLVTLEEFIGEYDGKTICTPTDADTFIDEGTIDAENAVFALGSLCVLCAFV